MVCSDITALTEQKVELHETNLRLDAALENMSQGLCLYSSENRLQVVNRRFCEIFGISPSEARPGITFADLMGLSIAAGNHGEQTIAGLIEQRETMIAGRQACSYGLNLSGGEVISITYQSTPDGGWLETYQDVTEQRKAESKIAFMARHDGLTELPNRSVLSERIEHSLAQAARSLGLRYFASILMISNKSMTP